MFDGFPNVQWPSPESKTHGILGISWSLPGSAGISSKTTLSTPPSSQNILRRSAPFQNAPGSSRGSFLCFLWLFLMVFPCVYLQCSGEAHDFGGQLPQLTVTHHTLHTQLYVGYSRVDCHGYKHGVILHNPP